MRRWKLMKQEYPETLETLETNLSEKDEKLLADFKVKYEEDLLPLYKEKGQISGSLVMVGFMDFCNGKWEEFMKKVKSGIEDNKGDDTNE